MDYEGALRALFSEHQATTKEAIQQAAARRTQTVHDMDAYLQQLGLVPHRRCIHIAGTKGKGSTAALCEGLLRANGLRTGLFTSPHLIDVRERIRIQGKPVSKAVLAQAYWELRSRLEAPLPGYFRMIVLLALYIFQHYDPALDVIVWEVGMGGRYDATNVLDAPVCGITLMDFDHMRVLGNTLEQISWEKGGIFRRHGAPVAPRPDGRETEVDSSTTNAVAATPPSCFVLDTNLDSVVQVLRSCAQVEAHTDVVLVGRRHSVLPPHTVVPLAGAHQRDNAELAYALVRALLHKEPSVDSWTVQWPGRSQIVEWKHHRVVLDGAHTVQSMQAALDVLASPKRVCLLFNCSHERSPVELLQVLRQQTFVQVHMVRSDTERPSAIPKPTAKELIGMDDGDDSTWQSTLSSVWNHLNPGSKATAGHDATSVLHELAQVEEPMDIFVTGSLYLVGSMLEAMQWTEESAEGSLRASHAGS